MRLSLHLLFRRLAPLLLVPLLLGMDAFTPERAGEQADERAAMVATIVELARETGAATGRHTLSPEVLAVMGRVERHRFVSAELSVLAYADRPLPIGHGQTISQPYIVALMTDLLEVKPDHKVLEVGTGSGYQAAVLAKLVESVHTIEIVDALGKAATERLRNLNYDNVTVRVGDGYHGWREHAPFDAVVVTAAASHVPPPLVHQLAPGGRLVIPVGPQFHVQQLLLIEKGKDDEQLTIRQILPVRFVPLTGDH